MYFFAPKSLQRRRRTIVSKSAAASGGSFMFQNVAQLITEIDRHVSWNVVNVRPCNVRSKFLSQFWISWKKENNYKINVGSPMKHWMRLGGGGGLWTFSLVPKHFPWCALHTGAILRFQNSPNCLLNCINWYCIHIFWLERIIGLWFHVFGVWTPWICTSRSYRQENSDLIKTDFIFLSHRR